MRLAVDMSCFYHQFLSSRELGGAAEMALLISGYLNDNSLGRVHVWIPGKGRAWEKAEKLRLDIQSYDSEGIYAASNLRAAISNSKIALRLRHRGPGIVHVHGAGFYGALRHGIRFSGLTSVVHVHIENDLTLLRWAFKFPPRLIITCASFLADDVRRALPQRFQENQRIAVVPNSVDIRRFFPDDKLQAKQKVNAPTDRPLLLMLANLAPHKGQETAIRAVAELKRRGVAVSCWLAGVERNTDDKRFTARLHSLMTNCEVNEKVLLLGGRTDAPELLRAADFLLLPSTREGLPLCIVEAQASKVPVLAAPTAGIPEIISDGKTGFLIPADDYSGYADVIQHMLDNPELYNRVAQNAYVQSTTHYNLENYYTRIFELYRNLLPNGSQIAGRARENAAKRSNL